MLRDLARPLFALLVLLATAPLLAGDRVQETDTHRIHYNVIQTSFLPEEVARTYGITRSDRRVLLNIAVHRKEADADAQPQAVEAEIKANAVNINGQLKRFDMEAIHEDEAIYYIGTARINEGETLDFDLEVRPADAEEWTQIGFRRQY